MGEIPEPDLDAEERRAFARGVDEFNRGYFFECHDTLEDLWTGVRAMFPRLAVPLERMLAIRLAAISFSEIMRVVIAAASGRVGMPE